MSKLTGRYKLEPYKQDLVLLVEIYDCNGFRWRGANVDDLPALEPMIADGWRFPEERNGHLDPVNGKRYYV